MSSGKLKLGYSDNSRHLLGKRDEGSGWYMRMRKGSSTFSDVQKLSCQKYSVPIVSVCTLVSTTHISDDLI